jgi:hypothetical protein
MCLIHILLVCSLSPHITGADPGFQVRGGRHLKKLRRAEGGAKIFGVFRVKNHNFTQKNHIFSNFRGGGHAPGAPPSPGSTPVLGVNCANKELLLLFYLSTNNKNNNNNDFSCFIYCVCKSCYDIISYTLYVYLCTFHPCSQQ